MSAGAENTDLRLGTCCCMSAQSLNHLLGFCQSAAVELTRDIHSRNGLASRREFAQSLLLLGAAEELQVSEVLSQGNWIGYGGVCTKGLEKILWARRYGPANLQEGRRGHVHWMVLIEG